MATLSDTRTIKEIRVLKQALQSFIESTKNGMFDIESELLLDEKMIWAKNCRLKKCQGKLNYDVNHKFWYCSECFLEQKLKLLGTEKVIRTLEEMNQKEPLYRNYKVRNLEKISQLIRNLYRIKVDKIEIENPNEEQTAKAKELRAEVFDTLNSLRREFTGFTYSNAEKQGIVYSLIQDGKMMNMDKLNEHIRDSKINSMGIVDRIAKLFSYSNLVVLANADIKDQEQTRKIDLRKSEQIISQIWNWKN